MKKEEVSVGPRGFTILPAGIALTGGLYLLFSIGLVAAGVTDLPSLLAVPGKFFFMSYSYLSFYVPLYLFTTAVLLCMKRLKRAFLFVLTLGAIPLLNFAVIFQLLTGPYGPAAKVIAETFGSRMGATLLLLTGAAEILALYVLTLHLFFGVKLFSRTSPKLLEAPRPEDASPSPGVTEAAPTTLPQDEPNPQDKPDLEDEPQPEGEPAPEEPRVANHEAPPISAETELETDLEDEEDGGAEDDSEEWDRFDPTEEGISFPELPRLKVFVKEKEQEDVGIELEEDVPVEGDLSREEGFPTEPIEQPGPIAPPASMAGYESEEEEEAEGPRLREPTRSPGFTYHNYSLPEENLLKEYPDRHYWVIDEETRQWAEVLKTTLEEFKISAEVTGIQKGPVITMFEILPAPGVKLSKIVNLADNIALRLAASRVRIVAPIPGKHAVGIEVPNKRRSLVSFREMLESDVFQEAEMEIPVILGKDITGETQIVNLTQTPHLLIAGATGSGKSVCVNSIICSILYTRSPDEVRMVLIDPKIVELKLYNDIPHLMTPVITEPKRAFQALQYLLYEMERRYSLLDALGVRDIQSYNRKIKKKKLATQPLPYVVVIVDEFADLMATSGKELESTLARLAAMSRAVGIHLVLATQRPSIDVITGLIKANIPSRIAFMVAGKFDSRIIIDSVGAEKLLGQGDMLFTSAWNPHPIRIQGAYLSEDEVEHVTDYVRTLGEPGYIDEEIFFDDDDEEEWNLEMGASGDPLMNKAMEVVTSAGKASASYLQRRLKIGYNRAARIVEEMEHRGIVGPQNGSKPREILHIPEDMREHQQ